MAMTVNGTEIGMCIYPLATDLVDYSRFDRDEFGEITVIQRGYSDTVTFQVEVEKDQADSVKSFLSSLRTELATYVGHPDVPLSQISGYLRSLKFEMKDWGWVIATFIVESKVRVTLSAATPAPGATEVPVDTDIVLTFATGVSAGTGNLSLYTAAGDLVEAFDVATGVGSEGGTIIFSGASVTATLGSSLSAGTEYYVLVDSTAISDGSGYYFPGTSSTSDLTFSTAS